MDNPPVYRNMGILPSDADEAARKFHKKMKLLLADYKESIDFRDRTLNAKRLLGRGYTLYEVREMIGLEKDEFNEQWEVLKYAVLLANIGGNQALEYLSKSKSRYKMAMQTMKEAHVTKEKHIKLAALKLMGDLDKSEQELKKSFQNLNLSIDPESEGIGRLSQGEETDAARSQLESVQAELKRFMEALAGIAPAKSMDVLTQDESREKANDVGQAPVDANPVDRPNPRY